MAVKREQKLYVCHQCGKESIKWLGHCPDCDGWNTFDEAVRATESRRKQSAAAVGLQQIRPGREEDAPRTAVGINEFNRVLGGGIVPGSVVLIGGDPGIGKSTLLLQVAASLADENRRAFYISGEESTSQIRLRAKRLGITAEGLFLLSETNINSILGLLETDPPHLVIVDSIQTVYSDESEGAPGSIGQIRECTLQLTQWAKKSGTPVFISGHVTKDGTIAGPRVLEHMVDVVLYLEGEQFSSYRLLRGVKNRFGSTNEIGMFEMQNSGLIEVANPSQVFLSQRSAGAIGSAVVPTLEGTRPLLVEVQALTSQSAFGPPRRIANGIDFNRLLMITAVLTKRAGLALGNQDILVNVIGGIRVNEPAADAAIALAIASSLRNVAIDPGLVAIGELGLSGELRAVPQIDRRLSEAENLGFTRCLLPGSKSRNTGTGMELLAATSIREAIRMALPKGGDKDSAT